MSEPKDQKTNSKVMSVGNSAATSNPNPNRMAGQFLLTPLHSPQIPSLSPPASRSNNPNLDKNLASKDGMGEWILVGHIQSSASTTTPRSPDAASGNLTPLFQDENVDPDDKSDVIIIQANGTTPILAPSIAPVPPPPQTAQTATNTSVKPSSGVELPDAVHRFQNILHSNDDEESRAAVSARTAAWKAIGAAVTNINPKFGPLIIGFEASWHVSFSVITPKALGDIDRCAAPILICTNGLSNPFASKPNAADVTATNNDGTL